ncbi:MAG: Hsp20/alpha crystallin family protein [Caulobacteraceae bacterium]
MNNSGSYYDPFQITAKLKDILTRGDPTEIQKFMQEILSQFGISSPFVQAFVPPLAQSLIAPLSQYLNWNMNRPIYTGPVSSEPEEAPKPKSLNSILFEIHGFVVIRVNVPDGVAEKDLKIFITPGYVTVKGDPTGQDLVVQLPPGTKKEGATAAFKDRVLEIKIPKEDVPSPDSELGIDYL